MMKLPFEFDRLRSLCVCKDGGKFAALYEKNTEKKLCVFKSDGTVDYDKIYNEAESLTGIYKDLIVLVKDDNNTDIEVLQYSTDKN